MIEKILQKPGKQLQYRLHYEPVHYNPQSDQHLSFLTSRIKFFHSFLRLLPVLFLLSSFLFTSCTKNPISSDNSAQDTGSRNYVWNIDTLTGENLFYVDIWAYGPNNIWVVSPTGTGNQRLFKYSGTSWHSDGFFPNTNFLRVCGSDLNNVWAIGTTGDVWKRNGMTWTKIQTITVPGYDFVELNALSVVDENNVFVGGRLRNNVTTQAFAMKYNGSKWSDITLPGINGSISTIVRDPKDTSIYYFQIVTKNSKGIERWHLYEKKADNFNIIYEQQELEYFIPKVKLIGTEVLFGIGNTICTYENKSFNEILNWGIDTYNFYAGNSRNDLFCIAREGLLHYNGKDVKMVLEIPSNMLVFQIVANKGVVVLLANTQAKVTNCVYRGVLKQ